MEKVLNEKLFDFIQWKLVWIRDEEYLYHIGQYCVFLNVNNIDLILIISPIFRFRLFLPFIWRSLKVNVKKH